MRTTGHVAEEVRNTNTMTWRNNFLYLDIDVMIILKMDYECGSEMCAEFSWIIKHPVNTMMNFRESVAISATVSF
jgi:hypothetical protein